MLPKLMTSSCFECGYKSRPWSLQCVDKQRGLLVPSGKCLLHDHLSILMSVLFGPPTPQDKIGRRRRWPGVSSVVPALSRGTGGPVPSLLITVSGRRGRTPSDVEQGWCRHLINNNISQRSSNYRPIPEAIKLLIWKKDCFLSLMNMNSSPEPKGDVSECPTATMKSDYK